MKLSSKKTSIQIHKAINTHGNKIHNRQDIDVEWMYELRQSPLCPPQTYDLHSKNTLNFGKNNLLIIPTDSVPTDAIPTICSHNDPVAYISSMLGIMLK